MGMPEYFICLFSYSNSIFGAIDNNKMAARLVICIKQTNISFGNIKYIYSKYICTLNELTFIYNNNNV